jgi:hypothetical protein
MKADELMFASRLMNVYLCSIAAALPQAQCRHCPASHGRYCCWDLFWTARLLLEGSFMAPWQTAEAKNVLTMMQAVLLCQAVDHCMSWWLVPAFDVAAQMGADDAAGSAETHAAGCWSTRLCALAKSHVSWCRPVSCAVHEQW